MRKRDLQLLGFDPFARGGIQKTCPPNRHVRKAHRAVIRSKKLSCKPEPSAYKPERKPERPLLPTLPRVPVLARLSPLIKICPLLPLRRIPSFTRTFFQKNTPVYLVLTCMTLF